jgi:hypothetical protein
MRVIQWLLTTSVSHQHNLPSSEISDRESEHPLEMVDRVFTPALIGTKEHFRVSLASELNPPFEQFSTQFPKIIYLSVIYERESGLMIHHRLGPGVRQINDA